MTDIKEKALALVNEVWKERGYPPEDEVRREDIPAHEALCRAVEQHEATKRERDNLATVLKETAAACADHVNTILQLRSELAGYKQEVSDVVEAYVYATIPDSAWEKLKSLIIPKPKPDPLVEVLGDLEWYNNSPECAADLRAALDAIGFEIREKGQ